MSESRLVVSKTVIRDLVRLAAFEVPGVLRVAWAGSPWHRLVAGRAVAVRVRNGVVDARVVIVARPGQPLSPLAYDVRSAVAAAIERLLGLAVGDVTVRIDGVGA
ncbi:MAG TPA: Asp23/Gls24 family envelope stress response protein [Patescibacteria group bacterium]|nr:Asp23/Gls24 family envelope stress response protein [Patescibacteria group bacterium]